MNTMLEVLKEIILANKSSVTIDLLIKFQDLEKTPVMVRFCDDFVAHNLELYSLSDIQKYLRSIDVTGTGKNDIINAYLNLHENEHNLGDDALASFLRCEPSLKIREKIIFRLSYTSTNIKDCVSCFAYTEEHKSKLLDRVMSSNAQLSLDEIICLLNSYSFEDLKKIVKKISTYDIYNNLNIKKNIYSSVLPEAKKVIEHRAIAEDDAEFALEILKMTSFNNSFLDGVVFASNDPTIIYNRMLADSSKRTECIDTIASNRFDGDSVRGINALNIRIKFIHLLMKSDTDSLEALSIIYAVIRSGNAMSLVNDEAIFNFMGVAILIDILNSNHNYDLAKKMLNRFEDKKIRTTIFNVLLNCEEDKLDVFKLLTLNEEFNQDNILKPDLPFILIHKMLSFSHLSPSQADQLIKMASVVPNGSINLVIEKFTLLGYTVAFDNGKGFIVKYPEISELTPCLYTNEDIETALLDRYNLFSSLIKYNSASLVKLINYMLEHSENFVTELKVYYFYIISLIHEKSYNKEVGSMEILQRTDEVNYEYQNAYVPKPLKEDEKK